MAEPIRFPLAPRGRPQVPDYRTGTTRPDVPDYATGTVRPAIRLPRLSEHQLRQDWWQEKARAHSWTRRCCRVVGIARQARAAAVRNAVLAGTGWFLAGLFLLALALVG